MRFHKVSFETGKQQLIYVITHYSARRFSNPAAALPQAEGSSSLPLAARGEQPGWETKIQKSFWASPARQEVEGDRRCCGVAAQHPAQEWCPQACGPPRPFPGLLLRVWGGHGESPRVVGCLGAAAPPAGWGGPGGVSPKAGTHCAGGLGKETGSGAAPWGNRRRRHKGEPESIKYF